MDSAFGFCKETCLFCVNICSGGIIDGPTHSRWGRTLLQATLGQGMVLSGAWTWNERRWCNVIQADIPQRWRSELLQVLILPPLFSSVFSKQAPSSDLPLKHVDTMVSVLYFTHSLGMKGMRMVDCTVPVSSSSIHLSLLLGIMVTSQTIH